MRYGRATHAPGELEAQLSTGTSATATAFDDLPVPAFALDATGLVTAWNGAAVRAFGWPAEEVLGLRTPFASTGARLLLERAAAGAAIDDAHPLDLPFVAQDGSPRRARLRSSPLASGGRVFVDGGGVDRVEVDRAEAWDSSLLQTILDAIPTPIWFKTTDGLYRGCNVAFEQALGKRRDELVGRPVEATGPSRFTSVYRDADRALFESGGTQFYEGELKRGDGEVRRVMFHKAAFRDHAGRVIGLAGALVDITDLRRTEEDLRRALDVGRQAESRFARLVESTPDLILIHRDGRIVFANAAVEAIAERPLGELTGTPIMDLVHRDDQERIAPRLRVTGRLPPTEGRLVGAAGRTTPVEFISLDLEMEDGPVRVAIGRDLTERKRAEERLQRANRLASLGTLAAGVAHELNNPLCFVLAGAQWSIDRLSGNGARTDGELAEVLRALGDVVQGAQRMRVIVADLKAAARDESGAEALAPIDLRRVIEFGVKVTGDELRRRCRLEIDADPVPPVLGSETRLGQVVVNLLVNAAQAMPGDDAKRNLIRIRLREVADGQVELEIADNGVGIPEPARPHLFEPFYTTKPIGEGTGLGLWVCHGIVTAHGGRIDVESELGVGTTLKIRLPLLAERAASARQELDRRSA